MQTPQRPLAALVLLVGLTGGQTAEPRQLLHGADPLPTANGTNLPAHPVTVITLDAQTGRPIEGTEIYAPVGDWRKPQPRRLTDAQGRYVVQVPLPPPAIRARAGNLNFSASHTNYAPRGVAWTASSGDVYGVLPKEVVLKLEAGVPIGGVVREPSGTPLASVKVLLSGSNYRGYAMGTGERQTHDYPQVHRTDPAEPAAMTDAQGRWTFAHFPTDLDKLELTFVRPDGSREAFSTEAYQPLNQRPLIAMRLLKEQAAVFTLRGGVVVRGLVVDDTGQPLAGALVKEGYGHGNIQRVSEFTTGPDGRFERQNRAPRQWIYTASAAGRATVSQVATVQEGMADLRIVLPPAQPLRVRVTDDQSQPVAGARLTLLDYRNEGHVLDWQADTDAEGRAVWTNAPTAAITFYVHSDALDLGRQFKAQAGGPETLVVLRRNRELNATVRIKAFDAQSRAPVKIDLVSCLFNGESSPKKLAEPMAPECSVEVRMSDVRVGMAPQYTLTISATNREPYTTAWLDLGEGDQTLEVPLTAKTAAGQCVVVLDDGKPATDARVWLRPAENADNAGSVFANAPGRYYGDRWTKLDVGADGKLELPPSAGSAAVVAAHNEGFLETTVGELQRRREVRLEPWARIEGTAFVDGKPHAGLTLYLTTSGRGLQPPFHIIYNVSSGADGRFVFSNVPPGELTLYRRYTRRTGTITPSHQLPLTVRAGQALQIEYGAPGRQVVGQAMPDPPDAAVDWNSDTHVLALPQPPIQIVSREDFATFQAFREAHQKSFTSPARLKQERAARAYELIFEPDGGFHIDDVPPGTYELRIRVTKADERSRFGPRGDEAELGSVLRQVTVPAGEGVFDLGTVDVPMKTAGPGRSSQPVSLTAQTLDGKEISLTSFRGKHVVMVLWAAWSQRSGPQLEKLKALRAEFDSEQSLAFLSLNLDDDLATARKESEPLGRGWTLARLEGRGLVDGTAALDVETLPTVLLLDAEGRVVARDLEGGRIRAAVQRALKRPKR